MVEIPYGFDPLLPHLHWITFMAEMRRYNIKRKKLREHGQEPIWLPVGTLVLFYKEDKLTGGRVELHMNDEQYNIFIEKEDKEK